MAKLQPEAGADDVTRQNVTQALAMAEAGEHIDQLRITCHALATKRLGLLEELARKVLLLVVADSAVAVGRGTDTSKLPTVNIFLPNTTHFDALDAARDASIDPENSPAGA